MATVNKSDRKKMIGTTVLDSRVVFNRCDTGEEFGRIDVDRLNDEMRLALMIYGAKQIIADVVSGAEGIDDKIKGMTAAITALEGGSWPRRASAANMEPAIQMIMAAQKCTREAALAILGM